MHRKTRQLIAVPLVFLCVLAAPMTAQNWCSFPVPNPQPPLKRAGAVKSEIGPGHGDGTTDPPCSIASCIFLRVALPADATVVEKHVCAADMHKPLNECVPVGNPVWWDCRDNPPYARFTDYREGTEGNRKYAQVTFKMWSDTYKVSRFVVLYKSNSEELGFKILNYRELSTAEKTVVKRQKK